MDVLRGKTFDKNSEIIAAFFTNRYYNDIYTIAKEYFTKNGGQSLTVIYIQFLTAHLNDIVRARGTNDALRDTIRALHQYYCKYLGEASLEEFIARIIAQIVPDEFIATMGSRERDSVLRDLVRRTALEMGKYVMREDMIRRVIDSRTDTVGVGILRDVGIGVLRDFKSSFISKLYAQSIDKKTPMRVVSYEIYDKIRAELRNVLEQYVQLEQKYKADISAYKKEIARLNARCASLCSSPNPAAVISRESSIPSVAISRESSIPSVAISRESSIPSVAIPRESSIPSVAISRESSIGALSGSQKPPESRVSATLIKDPGGLAVDFEESHDDTAHDFGDQFPKKRDDAPRMRDDAPRMRDDESQMLDDAPRMRDDESQMLDDELQMLDDESRMRDDETTGADDENFSLASHVARLTAKAQNNRT